MILPRVSDYPIRLTVTDDQKRNRLTVFFRLILAIPHFIWLVLWGIATAVAVVINWFATLIAGQSPGGLHNFIARYLRYATQVGAYLSLLADPYPGFGGDSDYPVDIEIEPPKPQSRWTTFFRVILALPAITLASALTGGGGGSGRNSGSTGALQTVAFLGWFVSLIRGVMPLGMRDLGAYSLGYTAQAWGYALLLTDRYPNSNPELIGSPAPLPAHPVRMRVDDDLRRSRLTVFFRLLLAIPHIVWLFLWGIAVVFAVIANWIVTLITGRSPDSLHRFLAAYVRYGLHVWAYAMIVTNRFPGFTGEAYDVDVDIAPPERQNRWITGFRAILAIPAALIAGALVGALVYVAIFGWFVGLFTARMPEGLRNLGAFGLRYMAQLNAYLYILTDTYPYSGPPATDSGDAGSEPADELGAALAA